MALSVIPLVFSVVYISILYPSIQRSISLLTTALFFNCSPHFSISLSLSLSPLSTMQLRLSLLLFILLNSLLCFQVQSITQTRTQSHRPNTTAAAAPTPASPPAAPAADTPKIDLIAVMSKKGCKTFADLLTAGTGDVAKSFEDSIDGGLTVFCPNDQAMKPFLPKFKNLTADEKASLLLYHGVPVYYSIDALKSSNGVMNTLATDGVAKNFNFTVQNSGEFVTLKTAGDMASIKSTIVDKDPLAVYSIDEVLEPVELFKPAEVPAPAPAPDAVADAPTAGKKKKHAKAAPSPAGPKGEPADQKAADDNAGCRIYFQWSAMVVVAAATTLVF